MSRRKQAKPRSLKREDEDDDDSVDGLEDNIPEITLDDAEDGDSASEDVDREEPSVCCDACTQQEEGDGDGEDDARSCCSDISAECSTVGAEGEAGSWGSSEGRSSCATPNSTVTEGELNYTLGATENTPHQCRFCEKAFPRHTYLKKHEQTHADCMPFRCEFCRRLFKHKRSRDRHIKLHTGDKKYRCAQCDAAFSRSDHLKIHMKTHDNQKPFQCTVCNRGYNTAAALTSHMQNHKRASAEAASPPSGPSYKCLRCVQVFSKPEDLQNHTSTHPESENSGGRSPANGTAAARLPCNYCSKEFVSADSLQSHLHSAHKAVLNGDSKYDSSNNRNGRSLAKSLPLTPVFVPPASLLSNFAGAFAQSLPSPFYCELCAARFPTLEILRKHALSAHGYHHPGDGKTTSEYGDAGKLYCAFCCLQFGSAASFAEHYIFFHNPFHLSTAPLSVSPPEQVKPTDLSVSKSGTSSKRATPDEGDEHSPRKKSRTANSTPTSTSALTTTAPLPIPNSSRYNYPGTLLCSQCSAPFSDFESFRAHVKWHIEECGVMPAPTEFACPHCGATFSTEEQASQHASAHFLSTSTEYGCDQCRTTFAKADELQKHLMDSHSVHLYSCSICKEVFDSKLTIQVHFSVRHSTEAKLFRCTACPSSVPLFHSENDFTIHVKVTHSASNSSYSSSHQYQNGQHGRHCVLCNRSFASELDMRMHLATHGRQFQCAICYQSFNVEYLLDKHVQTYHHRATNGICENGLENVRTSDRPENEKMDRRNESSHGNNNNNNNNGGDCDNSAGGGVKCDICEKPDFTSESEMLSHKKLVHHSKVTSSAKVSLNCAYCKESCKSRLELESHMKMHSQSTPGKHKCVICDEMCPTALLLAEHKLTHCKIISGKWCGQCKGSIGNEEQYYSHMRQHNNRSNGQSLLLPTGCVVCRQTLVSDIEIKMHAAFHLGQQREERARCLACQRALESRDATGGVCSPCYQRGKSSSFGCTQCEATFESGLAADMHATSAHRKLYECAKCQTSCDAEKDMRLHVASHMSRDARPEQCRLCGHVLPTMEHLSVHLVEHTFAGSQTYACYLCSSVFTTVQGVHGHMREHGSYAKPYDCSRCGRKFFFTAELEHHNYLHLEEDAARNAYTKNNGYVREMAEATSCEKETPNVSEDKVTGNQVQSTTARESPFLVKCEAASTSDIADEGATNSTADQREDEHIDVGDRTSELSSS